MHAASSVRRVVFLPIVLLLFTVCAPNTGSTPAPSSQGRAARGLFASEPYLVRDLATGTYEGKPRKLTNVNGTLYFLADDGLHGEELWKSDGTEAGTVLVKEFTPGELPSTLAPLGALGDTLFMVVGERLWKTDGTEAGTVPLRASDLEKAHGPVATLNGALYFFGSGVGTNGTQLWRTDGTEGGTFPLSSQYGGSPYFITAVNGTLLFMGRDSDNLNQLWKSDGTVAGTTRVVSLPPGSGSPSSDTLAGNSRWQVVGGTLFFAFATLNGPRLWKTDGTAEGTALVLGDAERDATIRDLRAFGGKLFFVSNWGLWRSDGTTGGTVALSGLASGAIQRLFLLNGSLFFTTLSELYRTDGTPAGTTRVWEGIPSSSPPVVVGSTLFFDSYTTLWQSDGTAAGTTPVTSLTPSEDRELVAGGSRVFFRGKDPDAGLELWASDGTAAGTVRVKDVNATGRDATPEGLRAVGDTLFFNAYDSAGMAGIWATQDGLGITRISANGAGGPVAVSGGRFFFFVGDGMRVSDGTASGTQWLTDSMPSALVDRNGTLFFTGGGALLSRSDGTREGTVPVKTAPCCIYPPADMLANVDGTLFFAAPDDKGRDVLWKSDGTPEGTVVAKDLDPFSSAGASFFKMAPASGKLFFVAIASRFDPESRAELWVSRVLSGGRTSTVSLGVTAFPYDDMVAVGGTLFFRSEESNRVLMKSDGFTSQVVKDFHTTEREVLSHMTALNGSVFFTGFDAAAGLELWKSDGTAAGTVRVKDLRPGSESSGIRGLTNLDGVLYFLANADGSGEEVWRSDGTEAGTYALTTTLDGVPLRGGWVEASWNLVKAHHTLYFAARDVAHGDELWALPLSALTCPAPLVVEATGPGTPVEYPAPTVAPDATGTPLFIYEPPAGSAFALGTTRISVSASGLSSYPVASCGFELTVRDTTPPTVSCPANHVAKTSSDGGAAVSFPAATATDAVTASPSLEYSRVSGSTFPVGTTEVTVTASDATGNHASCGFTITVNKEDVKPPEQPTPPEPTKSDGGGCGATSSGVGAAWLLLVLAPLARARIRRGR